MCHHQMTIWESLQATVDPPRVTAGQDPAPPYSPPPRTSTFPSLPSTLCITHDNFDRLLESSTSSSSSFTNCTRLTLLHCTKFPPIELLTRMTNVRFLTLTQCHDLTKIPTTVQLQAAWSMSLETLTITCCPDLLFSVTDNSNFDADDDDDSGIDTDSISKELQLTKLMNLRQLNVVGCGQRTLRSMLNSVMIATTTATTRNINPTSTKGAILFPNLKELLLPRNNLTPDDASLLFRILLIADDDDHRHHRCRFVSDQLQCISLFDNAIDTLDFVLQLQMQMQYQDQASFSGIHDCSRCSEGRRCAGGKLHGLRQLILANNPVMDGETEEKHQTPVRSSAIDNESSNESVTSISSDMDWSLSDDNTLSSSIRSAGSSRTSYSSSSSPSSSIVPFHDISTIEGLSSEQRNFVRLLQMMPQLHLFGHAFKSSSLYSKEADHLMNINRSCGRLLMSCSCTEFQPTEKKKIRTSIWPHVFEHSNRIHNLLQRDADRTEGTTEKTNHRKNALAISRSADAVYYLLRHGPSFAARESLS